MRQIGLFLIFLIAPLSIPKTAAQEIDSLKIFENITDIEKLIRQRQVQEAPPPQVVPGTVTPLPQLQDTSKYNPAIRVTVPLDYLYTRKENGTLQLPDNLFFTTSLEGLTFLDTIFYNPLFLPMIFTGKMLPSDLNFYPKKERNIYRGLLISPDKTFAPKLMHS
ncbi:MAG: hypothetical protein PHN65_10460, partial [Petrimonas mucosa]|nr:hypothetical protein [Petrimonas mucosa]